MRLSLWMIRESATQKSDDCVFCSVKLVFCDESNRDWCIVWEHLFSVSSVACVYNDRCVFTWWNYSISKLSSYSQSSDNRRWFMDTKWENYQSRTGVLRSKNLLTPKNRLSRSVNRARVHWHPNKWFVSFRFFGNFFFALFAYRKFYAFWIHRVTWSVLSNFIFFFLNFKQVVLVLILQIIQQTLNKASKKLPRDY